MLKKIPVYIFLLPLFVVIHVAAEFRGLINFEIVWPGVLKIFLAQLIIFFFARLFTSDLRKVSLIAFVFALVYFFFPDLKDYLFNRYPHARLTSYSILLPLTIVILGLVVWLVRRATPPFKKFNRFLNILLVLSIAADLPALFSVSYKSVFEDPVISLSNTENCDSCEKPDVYFLLFDAFTSTNTLRTEFGFENSGLDSFLSNKGFYVMGNSRSNYSLTPFSVSSCFNMNYLDFKDSVKRIDLKTYLKAVEFVGKSFIPEYFSSNGYQLFNESIFTLQGVLPIVRPYDIWDQDVVYTRQHFFWKLYNDIGWHIPLRLNNDEAIKKRSRMRDENLDANLALLKQTIKASDKPKFVYAHFLIPHGPYSRGANGEALPFDVSDDETERKKGYVKQVQYSNGIIRDLVNRILQNTTRPLVIMVLGDHGYRFDDPGKHQLEFPNLNAIYFSNRDYRQMKQDQSLVNNFRFVLNSYFGENLPLLKDSSSYLPYK